MTEAISESTIAPLNEAQRVIDTFVAPSTTFVDIRRKASWWGPLVILIVVSAIFSFATQQKVGWDKVAENNLHQSTKQEERLAQLPADQQATQKAGIAKITQVISYSYWIIVLVFTVIVALLVWATVNFGFAGTSTFSQVFAVYMYANLVINIKFLLAAISLFAGLAPDSFLQTNPVGTNVGFYLASDTPKWLIALATHIDIFEIWSLVLCVLGISIVARVKRGTAAIAVVGWWALFILVAIGIAAANS